MNQRTLARDLAFSPRDFLGFLVYLVALTTALGYGFAWSLRFPEFALGVIPLVCLAILWDDQRREYARLAMPIALTDEMRILDPLWDREIDS